MNRYNNFISKLFTDCEYKFNDKATRRQEYIKYYLCRTLQIFKYDGLPKTIPQRDLELLIQIGGACCVTEVNSELYAFGGGFGGEPNPYYMPTIFTVANPALNFSKNLVIDDDCIIINNDSLYIGIMPLLNRYINLLVENDISLTLASINSRLINVLTASTDNTRESAEIFLEHIKNGDLSIIGDTSLFGEADLNALSLQTGKTNTITDLIEVQQYTKASLYNELGLNANYNMKRESLNSAESQLNDDALYPFIDDMLNCRKKAIEKINNKYNTNISIDYNSSWKDNKDELQAKLKDLENVSRETITEKGGESENESTEGEAN
ncbi:MAG: hypothetical protein IJH63_06190 [Methanobrevibacter sp.]|nr:hypothetical protein [Methanobrevibacter sp.]